LRAKRALEALGRHDPLREREAGIVDEHVHPVVNGADLGCDPAHVGLQQKVADIELGALPGGRRDPLTGGLAALTAAANHDDGGAHSSQTLRADEPKPIVGAGDDTDFAVHPGIVVHVLASVSEGHAPWAGASCTFLQPGDGLRRSIPIGPNDAGPSALNRLSTRTCHTNGTGWARRFPIRGHWSPFVSTTARRTQDALALPFDLGRSTSHAIVVSFRLM
jgi:hypothetical protein